MKFPFFRQHDQMDCGPTCLKMIAKFYGNDFSLEDLRNKSFITREGVSLLGISQAAEKIGFRTLAAKLTFEQLDEEATLPCIIHWGQRHFVVVPPQTYDRNNKKGKITLADPAHGMVKVDTQTFLRNWMGEHEYGVALMLEPSTLFYKQKNETKEQKGFGFLFRYLKPYSRYVVQLILSIVFASILSLIFPFLTQTLVDNGVNHHNLHFVYLILISQLVLFVGSSAIELIRSWILLHMNSRINISIISDFLIKLMKLPIRFFDTKMIGDIQQRISDHHRIQNFLTGSALSTLFSFINILVFLGILTLYSWKIVLVFFVLSVMSVVWIFFFMRRRKGLDYKNFQQQSENQDLLYELITGMQEIKLNNCETSKRWNWERVQAKLYKTSIKSLALGQYQQIGYSLLTQIKNILISYISAAEVIKGNMTLGMMVSVSYIIGQLNSPLGQLIEFTHTAQDAKISLDRLSEIHNKDNEEDGILLDANTDQLHGKAFEKGEDLQLINCSFQYEGPKSPHVLKKLNLVIRKGKVTAIVGASGSGKTTLLKLLLKFYDPVQGDIFIGERNLSQVSPNWWRTRCGTVMQDGYIFSDTIANNIAVSDEQVDFVKLRHAAKVANIKEYIEGLPLQYETRIGNTGNGISAGQRQRFLIARAVYKNPDYLFFDEATSALDANNEKIIMRNLEEFFHEKTVVVIAHRLSTVKNADQIIVLHNGEIIEQGTHVDLTRIKGNYYELVKNQLELGQ